MAGLGLAAVGYPLGRRLLGDAPDRPPPEQMSREVFALAGVVAPAEEFVWGGVIEPTLGVALTGALFAGKHAVIDGRRGRVLGLALFWCGLGMRRRSRAFALVAHVGLNAGAVVLGHATDRDPF